MSDQIETSISKLIDVLRVKAPEVLGHATTAEANASAVALAISIFSIVAIVAGAIQLLKKAGREQEEGWILIAAIGVSLGIVAGSFVLASIPDTVRCMVAPDYCAIKSMVEGAK